MCYFCGKTIETEIFRSSTCPDCGRDLKICLNCKFYDPNVHWECRETIPEAVRDKERANFCDYFTYVDRNGPGRQEEKRKKARSQFDSLFDDG
jgi:hypothetical protein